MQFKVEFNPTREGWNWHSGTVNLQADGKQADVTGANFTLQQSRDISRSQYNFGSMGGLIRVSYGRHSGHYTGHEDDPSPELRYDWEVEGNWSAPDKPERGRRVEKGHSETLPLAYDMAELVMETILEQALADVEKWRGSS